jgi:threonine synthase
MDIRYHSTNNALDNGFTKEVSFREALFMGLAPDNGLFMPSRLPTVGKKEIMKLKGLSYSEVAYEILSLFLSNEFEDNELRDITKDAYDFEVPIERLDQHLYIVRLDRGPTASFKDFAARIMARMMHTLKRNEERITILVATSGDTGSAIGEAYKGLSGFKVYILYPKHEVSRIQKMQLDSIGENVQAIAVDSHFDDCQALVKMAFSDSHLERLNLTSANSINIGRILPQIIYYFYSYVNIIEGDEPVIFSIPSGNFGNSLACEIARRMGLPVKKIIIATNENNEFPRFLDTGIYEKIVPSKACLSNAMNVGNPSNLARYFDLYNGIVDKDGIVHKKPDIEGMKRNLYSISITDEATIETMKLLYTKYRVIVEPHGAVGVAAFMQYLEQNGKTLGICMETADPAKFPEAIKRELDITPTVPDSLKRMGEIFEEPHNLHNNYEEFKDYLLREDDR